MSKDPNRGRPRKKKRGPEPAMLSSNGDATGFRSFSLNDKRGYWKKKREDDQGDLQENRAHSLDDKAVDGDAAPSQSVGRPPLDPKKGPMRAFLQSLPRTAP